MQKESKFPKYLVIYIFLLPLLFNNGYAKIIHVPGDYKTIGDAISEEHFGDEVIVAPGIYKEGVTIASNIVLRSTFDETGDWNTVKQTVIEVNHQSSAILVNTDKCVIRGFTIHSGNGTAIDGDGNHATIENNIISGCIHKVEPPFDGGSGLGAGIVGCHGLIQNNIIENNESNLGAALFECNGTIQNNLIRNNRAYNYNFTNTSPDHPYVVSPGKGGALYNCNGIIRNNTIVDNFRYLKDSETSPAYWTTGGLNLCKGSVVNNIIYHTTMTATLEFDECTTPSYCLFRTPHPGIGNIAGDPKFIDQTHGDFHLKPDSPAIDAGKAQPGLRSDPDGHQRGLKGATGATKGDGSNNDIGAFEALPKPVALWLPNGGPPTIYGGAPLAVAWELIPPAGTDIHIFLLRNGTNIADLGRFGSPTGAGSSNVILPNTSSATAEFTLLATSVPGGTYSSSTPRFKITSRNAVSPQLWHQY